ncbi:hypothetical protein [Bradyrhizobium sp. LTSP885]|uniref:hypothetical protein n=1 Tax=Bradyrhizobium sp. LTSP885 TaxID=1619232 RepID=UPI0012E0084B|nr:hypothetical protein [Bradyrhizobium sp. LTSP885]
MMTRARFLFLLPIALIFSGGAHAECRLDPAACRALEIKALEEAARAAKAHQDAGHEVGHPVERAGHEAVPTVESAPHNPGPAVERAGHGTGPAIESSPEGGGGGGPTPHRAAIRPSSAATTTSESDSATTPLEPVRAYLRAREIPPAGAGAYGLVVFHSKATSANQAKLTMVCNSFVAFFPRQETASAPLKDQMVTIWPLDNPDAKQARNDDCEFAVAHYDLNASEAAISDAQHQHANFDGEGPYLVGWSPSNTRGEPDKLVLVIDMSADNSQALIDQKFLFWKKQIVEDPSRWRHGFSIESVRAAIRIFADQYGQAMLDAIKLVGDNKP